MDTRHPHRIVSHEEVQAMPESERRHFRPLTKAKAAMLVAMTPEQRGRWLQENPVDRDLVARIAKEERKMARKLRKLRAQGQALPSRGSKRDPERPNTFGELVRDALRDRRDQREQGRMDEHAQQADLNDLGAETGDPQP